MNNVYFIYVIDSNYLIYWVLPLLLYVIFWFMTSGSPPTTNLRAVLTGGTDDGPITDSQEELSTHMLCFCDNMKTDTKYGDIIDE